MVFLQFNNFFLFSFLYYTILKMITIICKIKLDGNDTSLNTPTQSMRLREETAGDHAWNPYGPGKGRINFVFERIPIILRFQDLNLEPMNELKKIRVLGDFQQPVCTLYELTYYFTTGGKKFPETADSDGRLNDDVFRQAFAELPKSNMYYFPMYMQYDEKDEQVFKNIITKRGTVDFSGFGDTPQVEVDEILGKHLHSGDKIKFAGRRSRVRRRNRQKSKKTKNVRRRRLFTKKC